VNGHAEAGAKGGQATRYRSEPCTATQTLGALDHPGSARLLGRTFTCQKQQTWKGPLELPHHHRWDGRVDRQRVTVIWCPPDCPICRPAGGDL
jgi:hypothetical protein